MRPYLLALAALALLVSWPLAAQDPSTACPTPANDTGFQEIAVNVNAGTFSQVLPFDVALRVCGTTTANTQVSVLYAVGCVPPRIDGKDCRAMLGKANTGPVELSRADCKNKQIAWGRGSDTTLDGTTFRSIVPRLEAERFYTFCFLKESKLTEEQMSSFLDHARTILDQTLAALDSGNISAAQSTQLRKDLADALLAEVDEDTQVLASGSLFDQAIHEDDVRDAFDAKLRQVLEPQLRRSKQVANFSSQQMQLRQALDQVRGSAALGRFTQLLEQSAIGNVNLATLLSGEYADELAVAHMTDDEAEQAALGQAAPGDETLDATRDPAAAGQVAERYQSLSRTLSNPDPKTLGLDELIQDGLGQGMISPFVKDLTAEERQQLEQLAGGPVKMASFAAFALAGQATTVQKSLGDRTNALEQLVDAVELAASSVSLAGASTAGNFKTAQNNYISADGGLLIAPEIDEVLPYIGTNIYFRPVNKDAPLRSLGSFGQTFSRRFALTLGLSVASVSLTDVEGSLTVRDNLFGTQNLVAGFGLRLTDMIRFSAGALVFKEDDPSPLINELQVTATYYVAISFDLDVASAFKGGFGGFYK